MPVMLPRVPPPPELPKLTPEQQAYWRRRAQMDVAAVARIAKTPDELVALADRVGAYWEKGE